MKVAVIGAGLAGLSAAWWLGKRHTVSVFERQTKPGFTAASVAVPAAQGAAAVRVDVPLRVFYPGYYPTLSALYAELGVASEPVSYAASFADAGGRLYFRYRNLRWGSQSYSVVAPQDVLLGARAREVLAGLWRFHREAVPALKHGALAGVSIGEFVAAARFPASFVEGFLLPAICTVCTCSFEQARAFPAEVIVDYLARGLTRDAVRRALHGADDVQQRLLAGIPRLVGGAQIAAVTRRADHVEVTMDNGSTETFDHLVFATQAPQARRLLADADAAEQQMLGGFAYTPVEVLTHSDAALMPKRRRDWSPVNLWVDAQQAVPESTIWINAVQPGLRHAAPVFQTVHPLRTPREDSVIGHARFERPVVGGGSAQALAALQGLHQQPQRRVWFCGSYAQPGIPLLESAVASAQQVARRLAPMSPGA